MTKRIETKGTGGGSLAEKLFPKAEEHDYSDSILTIPPEQRRLHTENYDFSIQTIFSMFKNADSEGKTGISIPPYQRKYVWTQSQASRLIESLIIQCPVPVIYFNQEADERFSIVDGNQRINSIVDYIDGKYPLTGLTTYPELNGLMFQELDARFQRHILHRTLRCIVIMKDTHPQVKFDVFERLNTGSAQLTSQEVRHGMYYGELIILSDGLAKGKVWVKLIGVKGSKRMRSEELVLRFLSMHFDYEKYKKPLSVFINNFCSKNRHISKSDRLVFEDVFNRAVEFLDYALGDAAFKLPGDEGTAQFNVALFDAQMLAAAKLSLAGLKFDYTKRKSFIDDLRSALEDKKMQSSISKATSDESSLRHRFEVVYKLLKRYSK